MPGVARPACGGPPALRTAALAGGRDAGPGCRFGAVADATSLVAPLDQIEDAAPDGRRRCPQRLDEHRLDRLPGEDGHRAEIEPAVRDAPGAKIAGDHVVTGGAGHSGPQDAEATRCARGLESQEERLRARPEIAWHADRRDGRDAVPGRVAGDVAQVVGPSRTGGSAL